MSFLRQIARSTAIEPAVFAMRNAIDAKRLNALRMGVPTRTASHGAPVTTCTDRFGWSSHLHHAADTM